MRADAMDDRCDCRCHDTRTDAGCVHQPRHLCDVTALPDFLADLVCRETLVACPRCQPRHLRETGVGLLFTPRMTARRRAA